MATASALTNHFISHTKPCEKMRFSILAEEIWFVFSTNKFLVPFVQSNARYDMYH